MLRVSEVRLLNENNSEKNTRLGKIASSVKNIYKVKDLFNIMVDVIKRSKASIAAIALVAAVACIVIIPPILNCISNNAEMNCRTHMYEINIALEEMLRSEAAEGGDYIQRTIEEGDIDTLLSFTNSVSRNGSKFDASDYYIIRSGDRLEIRCKNHETITGIGTMLSSMTGLTTDFSNLAADGKIVMLTAKGPGKYNVNDVLDGNDRTKMKFRGDEVNYLINNLTVTAHYIDGSSKTLARGDYTITAEELDMDIAGRNVLKVRAKSKSVWTNTAYAAFMLDVIGEDDVEPLIVEMQGEGKYELAAWDWKDFVAEAEESGGKTFGASIVLRDGKYYYYPDGFTIDAAKPNTDPFNYAYDTDSSGKAAYYIKFDTDSVIVDKNDIPHNGSVRAEKDLVYIWQEKPSKELPAGWIRVYCEIQKY